MDLDRHSPSKRQGFGASKPYRFGAPGKSGEPAIANYPPKPEVFGRHMGCQKDEVSTHLSRLPSNIFPPGPLLHAGGPELGFNAQGSFAYSALACCTTPGCRGRHPSTAPGNRRRQPWLWRYLPLAQTPVRVAGGRGRRWDRGGQSPVIENLLEFPRGFRALVPCQIRLPANVDRIEAAEKRVNRAAWHAQFEGGGRLQRLQSLRWIAVT